MQPPAIEICDWCHNPVNEHTEAIYAEHKAKAQAKLNPPTVQIVATFDVPLNRIGDLLVSAFEGGSNYWYHITGQHYPEIQNFFTFGPSDNDEPVDMTDGHAVAQAQKRYPADAVLNEGGYLEIRAKADSDVWDEINMASVWKLDLGACKNALQMMANATWKGSDKFQRPGRFWADFIAENDDAETADVFLQLALFGEVIYG